MLAGMEPNQIVAMLGGKDFILKQIFDNIPKIEEFVKEVLLELEQEHRQTMEEGGFTSIGWDITLIKGEVRLVLSAKKYRKKGDGIISKPLDVYSVKGYVHNALKEIQIEKIEDGKKD